MKVYNNLQRILFVEIFLCTKIIKHNCKLCGSVIQIYIFSKLCNFMLVVYQKSELEVLNFGIFYKI